MLSLSAEYALRIMAYLALHSEGVPLRSKDLAREANIPAFYLSKILRRMVTAGLLHATKGHGGGFIIARPPRSIRFSDIFDAIQGTGEVRTCVFGWDVCSDKSPCVLHERWKEARDSFLVWARKTTLADVQGDIVKGGSLGLPARFASIRTVARTGEKSGKRRPKKE